jgi:hypothetical protein
VVMETLRKYIDLFAGRSDCYGSWDGGCIRRPVSPDLFREHLNGGTQIGIYPAVVRNGVTMVNWGCTDIDVDDYDAARRIQEAFAMKDITTWVEKTRKGYHVWLFPTTMVPAVSMRNAYLVVHKVADVPPTEVNPKQVELQEGQVGNYVRLPYPNDGSGLRYIMNDDMTPMGREFFVEEAHANRVDPEKIFELAAMWKEPPKVNVVFDGEIPASLPRYKMGRLTRYVLRKGPREGKDRSTTMFYLACCAAKDGLSPTEIMAVLYDADHRWGKFSDRNDREKRIARMVEEAVKKVAGRTWADESPTSGHSQ